MSYMFVAAEYHSMDILACTTWPGTIALDCSCYSTGVSQEFFGIKNLNQLLVFIRKTVGNILGKLTSLNLLLCVYSKEPSRMGQCKQKCWTKRSEP